MKLWMLPSGFSGMNPGIKQLFPFSENSTSATPFIITGPCSVETPEQLESTVSQSADNGISLIRAGVWKSRTSTKPISLTIKNNILKLLFLIMANSKNNILLTDDLNLIEIKNQNSRRKPEPEENNAYFKV